MSSRISELEKIANPSGNELVIVAFQGANYSIRVNDLVRAISKTSLGLERVNNTSDAEKPISDSVAKALADKANADHTHDFSTISQNVLAALSGELTKYALKTHQHQTSDIINLDSILADKAGKDHNHALTSITGLSEALTQLSNNLDASIKNYIDQNTIKLGLRQW